MSTPGQTDNRYDSRKFILAWASLVVIWIAFLILEIVRHFFPDFYSITPKQVLDFHLAIVGFYLAANVGDQAVTK